jgi:hypothetical protein
MLHALDDDLNPKRCVCIEDWERLGANGNEAAFLVQGCKRHQDTQPFDSYFFRAVERVLYGTDEYSMLQDRMEFMMA